MTGKYAFTAASIEKRKRDQEIATYTRNLDDFESWWTAKGYDAAHLENLGSNQSGAKRLARASWLAARMEA